MKNRNFGFTLIELLVVIVIIGILATISTATFSGYFAKSRDTERQSFVRNAQQIILASQVAADTADYVNLDGVAEVDDATTATDLAADLAAELTTQGYAFPDTANAHTYRYAANGGEFAFAVCSEDDTSVTFEAGTSTGLGYTDCDGTGTTVDSSTPSGGFDCSTSDPGNTITCAVIP